MIPFVAVVVRQEIAFPKLPLLLDREAPQVGYRSLYAQVTASEYGSCRCDILSQEHGKRIEQPTFVQITCVFPTGTSRDASAQQVRVGKVRGRAKLPVTCLELVGDGEAV